MNRDRTCSVIQCDRPVHALEWCEVHYSKRRRYGDPLYTRTPTPMERFWRSFTVAENGCWVWTRARYGSGYGTFTWEGSTRGAHIFAYESMVGPVPDGLVIDHQCHNRDLSCAGGDDCPHRACVNPAHMDVTTRQQNTLRGRGEAAKYAARTECARGHDLNDPANIRPNKHGARVCRECARMFERNAYHEGRRKRKPKGWVEPS